MALNFFSNEVHGFLTTSSIKFSILISFRSNTLYDEIHKTLLTVYRPYINVYRIKGKYFTNAKLIVTHDTQMPLASDLQQIGHICGRSVISEDMATSKQRATYSSSKFAGSLCFSFLIFL